MKHILRSQDFTVEWISKIFADAKRILPNCQSNYSREGCRQHLRDRNVLLLFYQPSTRTRFSFEIASKLLGAHTYVTENAGQFSSAIKGETLEHTIRNFGELFADLVILRHPEDDAASRAAEVLDKYYPKVKLINAGSGAWQHPTQSLIDLFAIEENLKRLNDITVVMCGDLLHSRTTHSLAYLLSKYRNVKMIFVAPKKLRMSPNILEHLREHSIVYEETESLEYAFKRADVVYVVRAQKEYHKGKHDGDLYYHITSHEMNFLQKSAILIHPLPIDGEIAREVDDDPRAKYFQAVRAGLALRMALISWMLN